MPQACRTWREAAVDAREALRLLGYPVLMEECLPGEPGGADCGFDDMTHAIGYYMTIRATVDHYLGHVDDAAMNDALGKIYQEAAETAADNCGNRLAHGVTRGPFRRPAGRVSGFRVPPSSPSPCDW